MDRFKLHMDEPSLDENGQFMFFIVEKVFKAVQILHHAFRWRWNNGSVSRAATANPILGAAKLARRFIRPTPTSQQDSVNLSDEPQRKRKPGFHAPKTVLHRSNVIGNFFDVIDGNSGHCFVFK